MPSAIQRSFAGGEVSPAMYARADLVKYQTGLKTCRNFMVMRHGGVANRPGSRFIAEVGDGTKAVRLIKFVFNNDETYVLEFGHEYMRVIRDGVLLESTPGTPYEMATPYDEARLFQLQYVQSGDVVTIVHPGYAPRELRRTGHTSWTLTEIVFENNLDRPLNGAVSGGGDGEQNYRYKVTAVMSGSLEESLPGYEASRTITGATAANPVEITTSAAHGFFTGNVVYISGVVGMVELNDGEYKVTKTGANTFTLDDVDGTGYTAYTSGGSVSRSFIYAKNKRQLEDGGYAITVTWGAVTGAAKYNVYRSDGETGGEYGFVGQADTNSFTDSSALGNVDLDRQPPRRSPNLFGSSGKYPGAVAYTQQRLVFAGSNNRPEWVWMSRTGKFHDFSVSRPVQDDDSVRFVVAGRQVNKVLNLIELGRLIILTRSGEWTVNGDANGSVTPTAINLRQQSYNGSLALAPILISNSALYVQARGSVVRDLRYDFESDGYTGRDLTVFSSHLFDGYKVVDWDFAQIPNSIVWVVRHDGKLLGLTYVREHEVWGWHHHDTNGMYESVCVVPEDTEDAVYVVVRRTINGNTKRYIERFDPRTFINLVDAFFVDSGLTYDGRNGDSDHTMTVSGGTTWQYDEDLTLTSSDAFFGAGDVGNEIHVTVGSRTIRFRITAFTSDTVVTVRSNKEVPASFQSVAISDWAKAVDEISGLDHLEAKTVSILADGNVEPQQVVDGGAITLQKPHAVVHVGLPITSDFETLSLENLGGETLTDKRKLVNEVSLYVESSRGIFVGQDSEHLTEYKQRATEPWDSPVGLETGVVRVSINSRWDDNGRVFIRQSDPLPLTVLAVVPSGVVSGSR